MKIDSVVRKETRNVALGSLCVGTVFVLGFFVVSLLFDKVTFDYTVPLGTLYGALCSVFNFFLMALTVQKSLNAGDDAKKKMQVSFSGRMLLLVILLGAGVCLPYFQWLSVLAGAFFPRIVIFARGIWLRKHPEEQPASAVQEDGGDA